MPYTRGTSNNIIVGAAALFTHEAGVLAEGDLPDYEVNKSFKESLTSDSAFRNVGYTMNGLELQFQPDFGEVAVDQVLDVAKLFKQGMQVNLNTTFAESTLENLLFALASKDENLGSVTGTGLGAGMIAVSVAGLVDCAESESIERIYVAYRALSIENVTVSAKRDEATMFEVSFRLLPNDSGSYGKIVDRTIPAV